MSVIQIKNPTVSDNTKTFLSQEYTSGSTLYVENNGAFAVGNYIVIGEPNNEKTEATVITALPSNSTITVTAPVFGHPKGTPVYFTRWDKYALQYKTTSAGAWADYGSMPADLRWDALFTEYRDAAATSTYYWRYRYYSTESTAYSDYSDTISPTGWADNTVGAMVRNIRKIVNDPESKTISDNEIIRFLNSAQDKVYTFYDRWWFLFKVGTEIDTVASTAQYSLPSDFGRLHSVMYRYISGATDVNYALKFISIPEYEYNAQDNNASDDDDIKYYTIFPGDSTNATGYIKVFPKPSTAGLHLTPKYYKTMTDLDSYGDATEIPIPSMLEDYALAQIYKIRKEEDKASYYDKSFREQVDLLKLMQRKQVGPPRQLWKYAGRKALDRYYGSGSGLTTDNENNF